MPSKPCEINWELLYKSSNAWKPSWDLNIKESEMIELTVEQRLENLSRDVSAIWDVLNKILDKLPKTGNPYLRKAHEIIYHNIII